VTDLEICQHLAAVEEKLPETAISARLALSIILGEIARLQREAEVLRVELAKRPRLSLVREDKRAFDEAVGRGERERAEFENFPVCGGCGCRDCACLDGVNR
jgi:hypothetical protein